MIARSPLPSSASENEKDKLISEQAKTIRELEIAIRGYEDNLGEPLRAVREDVEKEWVGKVEEEVKKRKESERWAAEVVKQLEREKQVRALAFYYLFHLSNVVWCVGETEAGRRTTSVGVFCYKIRFFRVKITFQTPTTETYTRWSADSLCGTTTVQNYLYIPI